MINPGIGSGHGHAPSAGALARLTGLAIEELETELGEVRAFIGEMRDILGSRERRMTIMKDELAKVAETLSVDVADIVAFGDMPNDVPMLSMVGLGVAMGNAHPAAVAAADEVTVTNADAGVAQVLERWW